MIKILNILDGRVAKFVFDLNMRLRKRIVLKLSEVWS